MLELLFDHLDLLGISKRVLRFYDLFKLVSKPSALFHIEFDLRLHLLEPRASNVPLKALKILTHDRLLANQVLDLSLEVEDQVGLLALS